MSYTKHLFRGWYAVLYGSLAASQLAEKEKVYVQAKHSDWVTDNLVVAMGPGSNWLIPNVFKLHNLLKKKTMFYLCFEAIKLRLMFVMTAHVF